MIETLTEFDQRIEKDARVLVESRLRRIGRRWAWWVDLMAIVINLLLVLNAFVHKVPMWQPIVWAMIPVMLLLCLSGFTGFGIT